MHFAERDQRASVPQFRRKIDAAILSERRAIQPYGMKGGLPGQRGLNIWLRRREDGTFQQVNVGGKAEFTVDVGDHFILRESSGLESPNEPVTVLKLKLFCPLQTRLVAVASVRLKKRSRERETG